MRASASVWPRSCSVKSDAQAIAVVQPRHRKRASAIQPFSTRADSLRTSPQTGLLTSIVAVAPGSSPALRGLRKWSRTASLNTEEVWQKAWKQRNATKTKRKGFNTEATALGKHRDRREDNQDASSHAEVLAFQASVRKQIPQAYWPELQRL